MKAPSTTDPSRPSTHSPKATTATTSSAASRDGNSPLISPDGPGKSGPDPVPVSRFRALEDERRKPMSDTFGPLFIDSSPSIDLQQSLGNRLRVRLAGSGCALYALTWKQQDMPSGLPICALRASVRHTCANGSIGWPTPVALDYKSHVLADQFKTHRPSGTPIGSSLSRASLLADGWPTPLASNHMSRVPADPVELTSNKRKSGKRRGPDLTRTAAMAKGWPTALAADGKRDYENADRGFLTLPGAARITKPSESARPTPTARDWKDSPGMALTAKNPDGSVRNRTDLLPRKVGLISNGSNASTEQRGRLNVEFVRWLMGYPAAWGRCAAMATRLSRKSRRSS